MKGVMDDTTGTYITKMKSVMEGSRTRYDVIQYVTTCTLFTLGAGWNGI
jgi:hypothetical protein